MFKSGRGYGHVPGAAPIVAPFSLAKHFNPWNPGNQIVNLGAGGPSGFIEGTAGAPKPWPYITGTKMFIQGFPFGTASSLRQVPFVPNVASGNVKFIPVGYVKAPTGPNWSF